MKVHTITQTKGKAIVVLSDDDVVALKKAPLCFDKDDFEIVVMHESHYKEIRSAMKKETGDGR
jgi:hypothetical protein